MAAFPLPTIGSFTVPRYDTVQYRHKGGAAVGDNSSVFYRSRQNDSDALSLPTDGSDTLPLSTEGSDTSANNTAGLLLPTMVKCFRARQKECCAILTRVAFRTFSINSIEPKLRSNRQLEEPPPLGRFYCRIFRARQAAAVLPPTAAGESESILPLPMVTLNTAPLPAT